MGSSSQTQKTNTGPWQPTQGTLTGTALPRIEQQFQQNTAPGSLTSQAGTGLSAFLQPGFTDVTRNPQYAALTKAISDPITANITSMFSRAGRGTSASASGLGGALATGLSAGLAPTLFGAQQALNGQQLAAIGAAPSLENSSLNQYLQSLYGMASLGSQGQSTTTSTMSPLQSIVGGALGLGGLFSAPAGGTSAVNGMLGLLSDRRAKTDVRRISTRDDGLGVYRYRYHDDPPHVTRIGVMADEVEARKPYALGRNDERGRMTVNYRAL